MDITQADDLLLMLIKNKGKYISGEKVSEQLGVTRAAIWKRINKLKGLGYLIESTPRLGHKLVKSPDKLFPEEVWAKSKLSFLGKRIYYYSSTSSTNAIAKTKAKSVPHGTLIIAEKQEQGRGRLGRSWVSPEGVGIWLTLIIKPSIAPYDAPKLTLLTAVAVAKAIKKVTGLEPQIKWPNDILIKGKKVCGILTELSAEIDIVDYVIIGIGINVNNSDFPVDIVPTATSLYLEKGERVNRLKLLIEVLSIFEENYFLAKKSGFEPILTLWKRYCCNIGKPVKIIRKDKSFNGIAVDIDKDGALFVQKDDGSIIKVFSGDVSLR